MLPRLSSVKVDDKTLDYVYSLLHKKQVTGQKKVSQIQKVQSKASFVYNQYKKRDFKS